MIEVVLSVPNASKNPQIELPDNIPSYETEPNPSDHMEISDESKDEMSLAARLCFDCWP